jgi:acyl carrier protein
MNSKSTDEILEVLLSESAAILSVDRGEFSADTPLSALGFDSLRFVELLVAIEIHLKVKLIEIAQQEDVKTLRTLARCINRVGCNL